MNKETMQVSVIIPAYNHGDYILTTLESVFAQTHPLIEVIVVDDGSTDDTPQKIAKYESRLVYHRQANRGMAAARNRGISLAKGELISFLDDDDLWEPEYLQTVVSVFETDPGAAAVYTSFKSLDAGGQVLPQGGGQAPSPDRLYETLVDGGFFPACCLTVRREVLVEMGGLDAGLRGNDDWDLLLRLSRSDRVVGLPAPLALHREHAGGLSSNYEHMLADNLRAVAKHFGPEEGTPHTRPELQKRAYAGSYLSAAIGHLLQGDMDLGFRRLRRAIELHPPIGERLSTWYDIACSYQPKGWRGHAPSLDLVRSERLVADALAAVSTAPELRDRSTGFQRVHAAAVLALGLLAYQKGEMRTARGHLARAVHLRPALLLEHDVTHRYVKSLVGRGLLDVARRLRSRFAGARGIYPAPRRSN